MAIAHSFARHPRGITLLELITTVAVAGVSLAIVVPSWTAFTQRSQLTAAANQVLTHLRYARSEAVHRRQPVSLCPSDDGNSCSGDPFGWHRGYIVFTDHDGDRKRTPNEPLLRVQDRLAPDLRLHTSVGRPAIRFRADGAAWSTNATFRLCAGDAGDNRAVVLYGSGRARVDRKLPGDKPVSCS
jgi:type IV fimbrial biogenesis protein FimT